MDIETFDDPVGSGVDQWLHPMDALKRLGFTGLGSVEKSQLIARLRHGLVRAVAEHVSYREKGSAESLAWVAVPSSLWRDDLASGSSSFWWTSDVEFFLGGGYAMSANSLAMFGVRFNPDDIEKMMNRPAAAASIPQPASGQPTRRQDLPLLPEPIAQAWIIWFKGQPNATKAAAEESAAHMFPNHNLSRDRIRELFGPATPGRPTKTDK